MTRIVIEKLAIFFIVCSRVRHERLIVQQQNQEDRAAGATSGTPARRSYGILHFHTGDNDTTPADSSIST